MALFFGIFIIIAVSVVSCTVTAWIVWRYFKGLLCDLMPRIDALLNTRLRSIVGDDITSIVRSSLVILAGHHGISLTARDRSLLLFAFVYFVFPLDILPDVIPLIGYFDDLVVVYLISKLLARFSSFVMGIVRVRNNAALQQDSSHRMQWIQDDAGDCAICYGQHGPRTSILRPCGHKLCSFDSQMLVDRGMNCPFCRSTIESVLN